ncbi:AraC family transcriptional regulator [Streptomyces sp. NPDC053755]|uniref:helix-turn-helix transcriptional regulator n=1 Tax=Streptomyces sp. NPDC053755 TaxID=3155815 RepID=UPI003438CCF4
MCHPAWARALVAAHHLSGLARLRRVRDRIDREYARPLDVEALGRDIGMPAGQLARQFRLAYGDSPYGYLTKRRIERAAALLRGGGLTVPEVRSAVGCPSPGIFRARFTELVGVPPSAGPGPATSATSASGASAPAGPGEAPPRVPRPVRNREAPATAPRLA